MAAGVLPGLPSGPEQEATAADPEVRAEEDRRAGAPARGEQPAERAPGPRPGAERDPAAQPAQGRQEPARPELVARLAALPRLLRGAAAAPAALRLWRDPARQV